MLGGESRFLDDIERPRLAHVAVLRSPHAHAGIEGIGVPEHAAGLRGVFTAADLGGRVKPFPLLPLEGARLADEPHPVLAGDEVRYVGQPVAIVVADSRALAEDAAELVEVGYEALPAIVDPRRSDLDLLRWSGGGGDVEGAFASAAHVVRGHYALPRLVAAPIEPRGCVIEYDGGADLLTVWCSAQDPHRPRFQLSHVLGRSDDTIRVIVPDVGGAFGSKGGAAPEVAAVAVAAMELGVPLKWAEDRLENFLAATQGRGMEGKLDLALDADGRILAVRARLWADLGAYLLTSTHIPPHTTAMLMTGCYDIPAASVELIGARTNKVPTGPYRGAGRPEAAYLLECAIDDAARQLGIDPVELRRRNLVRRFPHRTPLGWTYDSGDYARCLELAVEIVAPEHRSDAEEVVGTGVGMYVERGGGMWEGAEVSVEPSGRVVVRSSSSPHGQGHDTAFAQIAAERLGLELDDIVLRFGDSAVSPRGVGTFASRSITVAGSALVLALEKISAQLRLLAAHLLEASPQELTDEGGGGFAAGERTISFRELAAAAYQPGRLPPGMEVGLSASGHFSSELVFSSGAYAAVVSIERATGRLRVLRLAAVDDVGTVINPLLVRGQVLGGSVQGLGECLVEEVVHDEEGQLRTASFLDYRLLTAAEIPPITLGEVSSPSPLNPLGAKGAGEGGAIGTLPAVANAVADALGGRHLDPPFHAEKLWHALAEADR